MPRVLGRGSRTSSRRRAPADAGRAARGVVGGQGLAYTPAWSSRHPVTPPTSSRADAVPPSGPGAPDAGMPPPDWLDPILIAALDEDGGPPGSAPGPRGSRVDLTSDQGIPATARARARLVAKAEGVLCGGALFRRVVELCDARAEVEVLQPDGALLRPGQVVLTARASARALLYAERTGLNFVQRLSGIATVTARYVAVARGRARILDTRKTTPNLRLLEKYAVRCGGGENHRMGLWDEAMVKNNHADLAGSSLESLVATLRARLGPRMRITAEARNLDEARAGVRGDADVILLDNFDADALAQAVVALRAAARGRDRPLELEASGGITLQNLSAAAASGVDRISIGALTHSAPALDFSFYLQPD